MSEEIKETNKKGSDKTRTVYSDEVAPATERSSSLFDGEHVKEVLGYQVSRRRFLGWAAAGTAVIGLAGCAKAEEAGTTTTTAAAAETPTSEGTSSSGEMSAEDKMAEMDKEHEDGIKKFLEPRDYKANQSLAFKMENGVKVFNITASHIKWTVKEGITLDAMAYNGTVPGPMIRITEGDKIKVILKNELKESTSIHWHGVRVPNAMDGVPFITQPPVKPGETFTYEFTAVNTGSHMYHSHHNAAIQVSTGLLGAFIIDPKDKSKEPKSDLEHIMILNDSLGGYTINGKNFPETEPIVAKLGQKLRIRYMNEGMMIHPMHLHGLVMEVYQRDGYPVPAPFKCDTLNVSPGERWDVIVNCDAKGAWAFHCHILTHAESEHGMHGMVTALIVQ